MIPMSSTCCGSARIIGEDLLGAVVVTTGPQAYRRRDGIAVPAALLGRWSYSPPDSAITVAYLSRTHPKIRICAARPESLKILP